MNKVIYRAVIIEIIVYLSMAIGGYYGLLNKTPDMIIKRPTLPNYKDYFMLFVRCIYPLYLAICINFVGYPLR